MALSSGRGLSGKWCSWRHSVNNLRVFGRMWVLRMAKNSIKVLIEKPHVSSKIRDLYVRVRCMGVCEGASLLGDGLCSHVEVTECRNRISSHIYAITLCLFVIWKNKENYSFSKCTDGLFSRRANVCLSLMIHIFVMMFHSSSCCLVDYLVCLLFHNVNILPPAVNVTQAALGGTLTFHGPGAAGFCTGRTECVYCLCMRVYLSVTAAAGGLVCVFTRSNFSCQLWSEHRLSSGMCTKRRGCCSSIMCL